MPAELVEGQDRYKLLAAWLRGQGLAAHSGSKATISPASVSKPTTAKPLAPSPEPAQQGFEAILSS
jgi:hypothetical protein